MSAKEMAYSMIDTLTEEELNAIIVILNGLTKEKKSKPKKSAASLKGIFHDVADPAKVPFEREAFANAVVENHKQFLEDSWNDNN